MALNLGSNTSKTVYVSLDKDGKAQFSLNKDDAGDRNLEWEPPALILTFELSHDIEAIVSKSPNIKVEGNVATIRAIGGVDSFSIKKRTGHSEDPKIVVTPQ